MNRICLVTNVPNKQMVFLLTLQEEVSDPQHQPQRKSTKNKQGKTSSKPSRILFEESTSSTIAPQSTTELLPSPSQIDPEFLAALPDDVRQEIEQAYKRKDSRVQVPPPGPSHVTVLLPEKRSAVLERRAVVVQSTAVQKSDDAVLKARPKQVN